MSLNWFDFGIIAVLLLSIAISFFRGFLRETISLITWVAGMIFAIRFAPTVSDWMINIISTELLRYIIAFVVLFMAVFIVGLLITMAVKRGVDATGLTMADRLLGGAFGAARGILLVAIVLMFMTMTSFKDMKVVAGSELTTSFMPMVAWLDGFLPQQLQQFAKWMHINDNPLRAKQENTIPDPNQQQAVSES